MTDHQLIATGEEHIIKTFLKPLAAGWPGAFGLQDDCAVIPPAPGQDLVVKTDPVRANVHFFEDDAAQDIAWKALAVNVSDLAAKAARPVAYTLALSFAQAPKASWLEAFAEGLRQAQSAFGCVLIGGDTDRAPGPVSIAVTVFGEVPCGRMVERGTARAGDHVFVSGTLGDAAAGLELRQGTFEGTLARADRDYLLDRYLRPQPRLGLRSALRGYARAAMDISDGLSKDLGRMCRAAGIGAEVRLADIPLSDALDRISAVAHDPAAVTKRISAGDDYEILCAVPPEVCDTFVAAARAGRVPVKNIGRFVDGDTHKLLDGSGTPVPWGAEGYDHFRLPMNN